MSAENPAAIQAAFDQAEADGRMKHLMEMQAALDLSAKDPDAYREMFDPELRPYLYRHDDDGPWVLNHPLVQMAWGVFPQQANDMLRHKQEMIAKAIADADWSKYLWLHERPYRLPKLLYLPSTYDISRKEMRELIRDFWTDTEFPSQHPAEEIVWLFRHFRPVGDELPVQFGSTVYRGVREEHQILGLSWTLSLKKARWFARRYGNGAPGFVYETMVRRKNFLAFIPDRGEEEVVLDPAHITGMRRVSITEDVNGQE